MNCSYLTRNFLASALEREVRQLVFIGPQKTASDEAQDASDTYLQLFAVDEREPVVEAVTFVPTRFESEGIATALARSSFDKFKASLFIWFGDATYRTQEAALSTLSFIASLPKGSGVVFDYAVERRTPPTAAGTALDVLASKVSCASGVVTHLIQPQAVAAMLRGLGFGHMTDQRDEELSLFDRHIVSALV
jgi:O-methyltransferase involved in polyketide biosynthesis